MKFPGDPLELSSRSQYPHQLVEKALDSEMVHVLPFRHARDRSIVTIQCHMLLQCQKD
jgi:hypothetical protein